ncbi:MAG TPA: hypothetical protein VFW40_12015, partial [Capsulimonadaceae bacterium]|nr:hypothetical protein [Capsulimonadaceae bacterium]
QRFVRAVLMRLTHPPVWLRRAMLGIPDSRWVGAIFAMLFAGLLASDIFFWMGKSLLGNHALGAKAIVAGAFWDALLVANTKWFATMGLLAIFWPRIARAWDSFFTRSSLSAYRWPVSTGRAWCFFLLALFAFSLFVKNVGASMSSQEAANNPQEILGVWQLRTNQNTYLQFLNDGTFVLLTKIGDEFAGGVGTYRFADNIHVEMKSSVVLNGAGVLAASPNSDQTAEVEFFNDQLRLSYDPDTQPQDWSRATDGTDPNNLVHSQGAQAYQPGDQNQLAPDTTQPTAGADQTIQSRDLYRYSGQ